MKMKTHAWRWSRVAAFALAAGATLSGSAAAGEAPGGAKPAEARIQRGKFLVTTGACNDCHTPTKMGPNGPEIDMTRMLSGHPETLVMPPAPRLPPGPWVAVVGATMTAWAGPWGTSFTANLTPDEETGIGRWTERNFVDTVRNARHLGQGRPLLPPMPVWVLQTLSDEDLGAMFAYLRSIPAIRNRVPAPLPPPPAETAAR
jgi:mono/diheme cytochrome c family protein